MVVVAAAAEVVVKTAHSDGGVWGRLYASVARCRHGMPAYIDQTTAIDLSFDQPSKV